MSKLSVFVALSAAIAASTAGADRQNSAPR